VDLISGDAKKLIQEGKPLQIRPPTIFITRRGRERKTAYLQLQTHFSFSNIVK